MARFVRFLIVTALLYFISTLVSSRPSEQERVELWHAAGNMWPPTWQPETEGMKRLMEFREKEIMRIDGADERWENWMQYTQSRLVPKFTARGFDVTKIPSHVYEKLLKSCNKALENFDQTGSEGSIDVIYNPPGLDPKFAHMHGVQNEVHEDLRSMHEEWAGGRELIRTSAYGIRMYQNGSSLVMHHDKVSFF